MTTTTRSVHIDAPVRKVFDTVAHIDSFSKAVPHIKDVEFLTEVTRGVGTKFEETREIGGREGATVLEVTEYVPDERVRFVSDAGGTIWDTVFDVSAADAGGTDLDMVMEARPHTFLARITTPMVKGMVTKGIEADLAAVKQYCESGTE